LATKHDLKRWMMSSLTQGRGSASIRELAWHIWENHENDLRASGDLFVTWQYDMRWAALELRKEGKLKPANPEKQGIYELA
jgi:hypothetical protein